MINITLHSFGRVYKGEGKTVVKAIESLKVPFLKGHGVLVLENGKKRRERILPAKTINGLFGTASPTMKTIAVKNITTLFNDIE